MKRATFNSRPWKEAVVAHIKAFLLNAPLSDIDQLATSIDHQLAGKGFQEIEKVLLGHLETMMAIACKDRDTFINTCENFFTKNMSV